MDYLLDTHAFLWWIAGDSRISSNAGDVIADPANRVFLSVASAWEMIIKAGIGRLTLQDDPLRFIPQQVAENAFAVLPIELRHALQVFRLPSLHRDPFDRLLVAQAQVDGLTLLSADPLVAQYPVSVIW